ncbi:MAG: DNA primase [Patescibacteria group bacterium]
MHSPVSKIKERLTIEDVVSSYIKIEKVGPNFKAKCPFHNEKTPSFFISPERGTYYCFGCGAKGDVFSFVEEFEGLDFKGTLKLLAERAGIPLQSFNREEESEKDRLHKAMEEATLFFINNLKQEKEVLNYLNERGLQEKTIKDFRIGYAKADWTSLYLYLKSKKFTDYEIEKAGLAKKGDKGTYDRFRGRVMFPIMDSSGRVIAFSGRIFIDDEKSAKYLNSPETPIFTKSAVLYGLDKAKDSIRKNNFSILVEGQMDLLMCHQAGFRNTIATSGTALTDQEINAENVVSNLGLVRRLSENIVLAFDADKAGLNATHRAGKIALSLGMNVKAIEMEEGVDPADLILKNGVDAWKKSIRESKHLIEFFIDSVLKKSKDMRMVGLEIKKEVLPFVNSLPSAIEKAHFLKKIHDSTNIPLNALEEDLKKVHEELKNEKRELEEITLSQNKLFRKDYILNRILGIIFWQKTIKESSISLENTIKELERILDKKEKDIFENVENKKEDLIFEAETFYNTNLSLERDVGELLANLEEENLKEKLAKMMWSLQKAEEDKDVGKSNEILKECQIINNKIQDIKNSRKK